MTLSAVAGAGKSYFVTDTVKKCRPREIRVAVAAPTNEQVFSLVHSIAVSDPTQLVAYVPAQNVELPSWARHPNVSVLTPAHQASGLSVVVGTIHKLASAINPRNHSTPALGRFDALITDESYQANSASYMPLPALRRAICASVTEGRFNRSPPSKSDVNGRDWQKTPFRRQSTCFT